MVRLGTGIGWRPEIAGDIARLPGIDWVEVVAENICPTHVPDALRALRERGTTVVPHGVSLGLGGAERPDEHRLAALAERAEALGAPLVTEHIAFVRAGGKLTASPGIEAGHLMPVPRTREALDVLCANVRIAQAALPVPLALENIAALISWPGEELTEGQFLTELVERTGVGLLIDVANLHTNHVNRGEDPTVALDTLPTSAIAYVHVAGGVERDGVWHDSHAHPVTAPVLEVLAELCARTTPPGVLLERDDNFPPYQELAAELEAIRTVTERAALREAVAVAGRAHTASPAGRVPALAGAAAPAPAGPRDPGGPGAGDGPVEVPGAGYGRVKVPRPRVERAADPAGEPGDAVRSRLALDQTALLSALVAGTPAPEGFDRARLKVQNRALIVKRAGVVARIAPELPRALGADFRPLYFRYARSRPMTGGYRRDALAFAEHLLAAEDLSDPQVRQRLRAWWLEQSAAERPHAHRPGRLHRLARTARHLLRRRRAA
ncbi:DUF692 domain-containing protein [Streptomyces pactum]|uniref:DUF692 domain-containing protein n=1 Tax=Streptomyces pactum TaxID=68249 RepID=A0ABS0NQS7_9ACTN|nr:DUF692 domain-containing protein [Streptomyces pactum]MBH5337501.1 DUF692 domain-containing protein [Streptomyces pactum]